MHLTRANHARPLRLALAGALVLTTLGAGVDARGDEKEICVRAVERAQVARLEGKLRKAHDGFVVCARSVCPDAIREDCTHWVSEVDASLPSVVFEAVWSDGRDATGMTVRVDGQPLGGADVGRAVTLDPGEHTFRFEVAGAAPVESLHVIREGEKNRILRITFTPVTAPEPATGAPVAPPFAAPPAPTSSAAPAGLWRDTPASPTPTAGRPVPPLVWVLGGIGLAGISGFVGFGLSGTGQLDSLRSTCGHNCNPSDVDGARNQLLVGDILGVVGLAASGVATWLFLTRPSVRPTP